MSSANAAATGAARSAHPGAAGTAAAAGAVISMGHSDSFRACMGAASSVWQAMTAVSQAAGESVVPTRVTMVDLAGIYKHDIVYCECPEGHAAWEQLFRMGYFPASTSKPSTVFTFRCLDYLALDQVEAHTPLMSFLSKIKRCTDNLFPQDIKVYMLLISSFNMLAQYEGTIETPSEILIKH